MSNGHCATLFPVAMQEAERRLLQQLEGILGDLLPGLLFQAAPI